MIVADRFNFKFVMLEETANLQGYELIDSGEGSRLERFGGFVLSRPDPAALWKKTLPASRWDKADAVFIGRASGRNQDELNEKGNWRKNSEIAEKWLMNFVPAAAAADKKISFYAKLTPFKHTGIFPEQVANWNFLVDKFAGNPAETKAPLRFLNLFGYTGIASVLAAQFGAEVTHVDASKPSIFWAKENMLASGLPEKAIRWIFDDCLKFVKREAKRGKVYDAILMDPPAFGRGPKGEVWKFNESLPKLFDEVRQILSPNFKFVIINAYAVSVSSVLLKNMFEDFGFKNRKIDYGELMLRQTTGKERYLSTGIFARLY